MAKFSDYRAQGDQSKNVTEDDIKSQYEKYKNLNQSQLNEALLNEVFRQKKEGSFDYSALENMVNSLQTVLPKGDYENIKRLLESIK